MGNEGVCLRIHPGILVTPDPRLPDNRVQGDRAFGLQGVVSLDVIPLVTTRGFSLRLFLMSEHFKIERYKFSAWTEKDKNGFYGHWNCECGETGMSNHLDSTERIALAAAKVHAGVHYGATHVRKKT